MQLNTAYLFKLHTTYLKTTSESWLEWKKKHNNKQTFLSLVSELKLNKFLKSRNVFCYPYYITLPISQTMLISGSYLINCTPFDWSISSPACFSKSFCNKISNERLSHNSNGKWNPWYCFLTCITCSIYIYFNHCSRQGVQVFYQVQALDRNETTRYVQHRHSNLVLYDSLIVELSFFLDCQTINRDNVVPCIYNFWHENRWNLGV